jgi:D-aspartate ligase
MASPLVDFDRSMPVLLVKLGTYPLHAGTVGAIRSLGRVGVPVYAITEDRLTPAALSRYLTGRLSWPTTGSEPVELLGPGLRALTEGVGRRLIAIPTGDEAAVLVAEQGPQIEQLVVSAMPVGLARTLASKRGLYELCRLHGIPTANAAFPASLADVFVYAEDGPFPIVVKNLDPFTRLSAPAVPSTTLVGTPAELVALARAWPDPPHVILQEQLPKDQAEDWIFHMYCNAQSECLAAFTGVKLRSWPPQAGVTAAAVIAPNDEVTELSTSFCRAIGYHGIGDLDWRFDRRDGRYKLLDFNPRVGAQFRLFETDAAVDVVRAMHLDLTGREVPSGRQIEGRRFYLEDLYPAAVIGRKRAAQVPKIPRRLVKPELGWFALDDPLPALSMAVRVAWLVLRRLGRVARAFGQRSPAAAAAAAVCGAANLVPATKRISGPNVAADGNPVKNSPGTEDSPQRESRGQP